MAPCFSASLCNYTAMLDDLDAVARTCLGYRARMAALNVTRLFNAAMREAGLPITQFLLLVAIARNAAETQEAYAGVLGLERTTFLRNLKLTMQQGWVERGEAARKPYRLTAAGEAVLARALPHWAATQAAICEALGPGQLPATYDSLRRLARLDVPVPPPSALP